MAMQRVAVIDYGMGNLRSVEKALSYVAKDRHDVVVTRDPKVIANADRVVFPGQGAIRDCMAQIRECGLESCIVDAAASKPFLGICIGLQALMASSDEDETTKGLAVFRGGCKRFPANARDERTTERLKIPHMGWNQVAFTRPHALWEGIQDGARFYFVHSYYVEPQDPALVVGTTDYATTFACAIATGSLFAVQFHPEKSQHDGLQLLTNFLDWHP
jgi:glutamine amidotransferase